MTKQESISLSYVRISALLMIVLCHYCQAYGNKWAYVFNVGVQIFFALSGFLYGQKEIDNWWQWSKKRFVKLYIPMFVFLTMILPLYFFFRREELSIVWYASNYLNLQGFSFALGGGTISGIRHLWFMTAIALCYCSTPLLQLFKNKSNYILPILILLIVFNYYLVWAQLAFMLSWILVYAAGYLFANIGYKRLAVLLITILMIALSCVLEWSEILNYFNPKNRLWHDLLGIAFLLNCYWILSNCIRIKMPEWLTKIDKYSFHIYIIHYFLLIGPFSMAHLFDNILWNVIISFGLIVVMTTIYVQICNRLKVRLQISKK